MVVICQQNVDGFSYFLITSINALVNSVVLTRIGLSLVIAITEFASVNFELTHAYDSFTVFLQYPFCLPAYRILGIPWIQNL